MTAFDPEQVTWGTPNAEPATNPDSPDNPAPLFDPKRVQWENQVAVAPQQQKPGVFDPSKVKWGVKGPDVSQVQFQAPRIGRKNHWLYGVGPADVLGDYKTNISGFNKPGIREAFRHYVNGLGEAGFTMGVYDFNRGHHYAPNDPHLDGRAMDVDIINNEPVDTKLSNNIGSFITAALHESPHATVGVPKEIYKQLPKALQARAFIDAPAHIHVQLDAAAIAEHEFNPAVAHMPVSKMVQTAGLSLPLSDQAMRAWSQRNAEIQGRVRAGISLLQRLPIGSILNTMGSLQRGVGMMASGMESGHGVKQIIGDIWHGMTDASTADQATQSIRVFGHSHPIIASLLPGGPMLATLPTKQQVKAWVNETDIPAEFKPYMSMAINATADFEAQTISDPMTYFGGLGIWTKGIGLAMRGLGASTRVVAAVDDALRVRAAAHVAGVDSAMAAVKAAKAAGGTPKEVQQVEALFKHIPLMYVRMSAAARDTAGRVAPLLKKAFTRRPELEDFTLSENVKGASKQAGGFDRNGKMRRMAIENSELGVHNRNVAGDAAAARSADPAGGLSKQYLTMMYRYGAQADSDVAAKMLGLPKFNAAGWLAGAKGLAGVAKTVADIGTIGKPNAAYTVEDALGALVKGRRTVRQYRTALRTMKMVEEFPDALRPGSTPKTIKDWLGVAMDPKRKMGMEDDPMKVVRELMRSNVMLFPYPHGLVNVGTLSVLGAERGESIPVAINAFRHMLYDPDAPKQLLGALRPEFKTEMEKAGGAATYVHEHDAPGLWAKAGQLGMLGHGMEQHVINMQSQLARMESGWRQALWESLKEHPATRDLDPLLRGAMVAEKAGDPRNVTAFARMFEQFGGPFVAYRLGIVPRAVFEAIAKNPERVLGIVRAQWDIQHNRSDAAQQANILNLNNPVESVSRMLSGPEGFLSYILSPSTTGIFGMAVALATRLHEQEPWEQLWMDTLSDLDPLSALGREAAWLWPHTQDSPLNPMPGQKMSLVDHFMGALLAPLASFFFAKQVNARAEAQKGRRLYRNTTKFDNALIDVLEGKGQ